MDRSDSRIPHRWRKLERRPGIPEVTLTSATGPLLTKQRVFEEAGITLRWVPIAASQDADFGFQWIGRTHYLALHDLQRTEGETFSDSSTVDRRKDLRGTMTFAPAGCAVWGWGSWRSPGSFSALYLDPDQMEETVAQKLRYVPSQTHVYFSNSALRSTLEKMQWALSGVTADDAMYLESLCVLAVMELCVIQQEKLAAAEQPAGQLAKAHTQKIVEYVDANLAQDIGLNDLANLAGLSRFHFARAFKRTIQETPYQYLLRRRIERAQALLKDTDMSVAEVAAAVGFKDTTRFIRAFRRTNGLTPGSYRR